MSMSKQEYKGPETGGKASSVKLENWKPDYSRAFHIVKAKAKSEHPSGLLCGVGPDALKSDHLQQHTLHVSCDITRLVDDLGLSRQLAVEDRPQAVMSFTVTAELGYYLLSVYVEWTDPAALPRDHVSRHQSTHLRDTFLELYKTAILCYAPQVLQRNGICMKPQTHMVMVKFFAIPGFMAPFLHHVQDAPGLMQVSNLHVDDEPVKFTGLQGCWQDSRALAKKLADRTAGHGLCRHLHDQHTKPKRAKGQSRQISLEGLSQMSQLLTLEPSLTQKDGSRCMAMILQGTGSEQHAVHNGTLVLVHAEVGGGKAVLCRALHSGTFITADGNFLHTKCENTVYLFLEAYAAWQFPELKDKVLVLVSAGCKNKKKLDQDMWNKMSPEEEVTVQVQDSDISRKKQTFRFRKFQLAVWKSENFVRIARDAFDLRRQEEGKKQWDDRWCVSKAVRHAWMQWARSKLKHERSVASASVLRMDQLHVDCSAPASDLAEQLDGPEGPDNSDSLDGLEVFHSGERARPDLTPEKAHELGYAGGQLRVKERQGDTVSVSLAEGDAWMNVNEVVHERGLQVAEAASSSYGGSGSMDPVRPPFLHRPRKNFQKGAWLGA